MYDPDKEYEKAVLRETLSIQDLIESLSKYPKDMKVITTWESTLQSITKESLYLSKDGTFVFLDADYCSYKNDFAHDPKENEAI